MTDGVTNPHGPSAGGFAEDKGKGKSAERVHDDSQMDDDDDDDDDEEEEDEEDFEGEVSASEILCHAQNNSLLTSRPERRRYELNASHFATSNITDYDANATFVTEDIEDGADEVDLDNIVEGGRRTRGAKIDFAKAAAENPAEDEDDEDDEDFEPPAQDTEMSG